MSLHLLMISPASAADELSVHPDHDAAWAALLRYIDARWGAVIGSAETPDDENERVEAFFRLSDSFYLIGELVATLPAA